MNRGNLDSQRYHSGGFIHHARTCRDIRQLDDPIFVANGRTGEDIYGDKPTFALYRDAHGQVWALV